MDEHDQPLTLGRAQQIVGKWVLAFFGTVAFAGVAVGSYMTKTDGRIANLETGAAETAVTRKEWRVWRDDQNRRMDVMEENQRSQQRLLEMIWQQVKK